MMQYEVLQGHRWFFLKKGGAAERERGDSGTERMAGLKSPSW